MKELITVNMPFECHGKVKIMQGFHGPWSHMEMSPTLDLSYAVDFVLPLGTPVLAVGDGVTMMVYDRGSVCYQGSDPLVGNKLGIGETNFIYIKHVDGTLSLYSHLEKDSVRVTSGQEVKKGQQLARTGLSGWVGPTPHLHFQLVNLGDYKSVPFRLNGYPGSLEHSELG